MRAETTLPPKAEQDDGASVPPEMTNQLGDLTPAYVRWMFETDIEAARRHYRDRLNNPIVAEIMEELGLE